MKRLAVVCTSASRPDFLKLSVGSAIKYLDIEDANSLILHEDFCDEKKSNINVFWAKGKNFFDEIVESNPRIGLIGSCMAMLTYAQFSGCDYVLRVCDDFIFTDYVDVSGLLDIMDNNRNVNQIIFNKRINNGKKGKFIKKGFTIGGQEFTVSPRWSSLNSIWRVDFIYVYLLACWNRIKGTEKQFAPWKEFTITLSEKFNVDLNKVDSDWIVKNLGCYLYGGAGDADSHVNVHIGGGCSRVFSGK